MRPPTAAPRHILVVDDERSIRDLMHEALLDADYTVETAASGVEAWHAMALRRPDVLVLDLMMPELNGRDLMARMQADPHLGQVRVVLVTATYDAASEAERVGADAWLSKPFAIEALLDAVAMPAVRA